LADVLALLLHKGDELQEFCCVVEEYAIDIEVD
jgi:hypothetical protein